MARCAVLLRMFGEASVTCASRRQGWRVAPANGKDCWELLSSARRAGEAGASRSQLGSMHQEGSDICALRSFIWRIACLHCSSRAPRRTGGAARR
ncbi:hypothetical protein A2U01_0073382, partial [Trifolium medium]|nr:hypothetical protein [Trifolium medium]